MKEQILHNLKDRKGKPLEVHQHYAVLLPLVEVEGEWHILYEVRSSNLVTQPGEISFPGGRVEEGESPVEAAIRETCEELGLAYEQIEYVGELDYIASPFNLIIYAYVGILRNVSLPAMRFNTDEVEQIFTVPLSFFFTTLPTVFMGEVDVRFTEDFPYDHIPNGMGYRWRKGRYPVHFYWYEEFVIWGITARLTTNFIEIIQN